MRHLLPGLLLALTACAADPVLLPDAGPCSSACGAGTVCQAGACVAVDGGPADTPDVAVDAGVSAPCVPACGAGQRCESGACVAFDGGTAVDVAADVPPLSDAARAMFLRTCEPLGSSCADGLTCLAYFVDAGQGVCTRACAVNEECRGIDLNPDPDMRIGCERMGLGLQRTCVRTCELRDGGAPCPSGQGVCRDRGSKPRSVGVCAP